MRIREKAIPLLFALISAACSAPIETVSTRTEPGLAPFPATYEGVLPCADCQGIRYTLNLFNDGVYYLRLRYLGGHTENGDTSDRIGRWSLDAEKRILTLNSGEKNSTSFACHNADTLRKLDSQGGDIVSSLHYSLKRKPDFEFLEPSLKMTGMYVYFADAATFTECLTGRRYPVAVEAESPALERAYLNARHEPMAPVLAEINGKIAVRTPMEGPDRAMVVVQSVIAVRPGQLCAGHNAVATLEETVWQPTSILDSTEIPSNKDRQPFIELLPGDTTVAGFTGCNTLRGSYQLEDNILNFGSLAMTRRFCRDTGQFEQAMLRALNETATWKIQGSSLILTNAKGTVVAEFKAVSRLDDEGELE